MMINEAEAQAANIWVNTFGPLVAGSDVLLFIDNTAAEGTLLRGYSASQHLLLSQAAFGLPHPSPGYAFGLDEFQVA